ncbi:hypothetical protein K469DRAFT_786112, partial [Zopfia rhizophila CBS 207.26]
PTRKPRSVWYGQEQSPLFRKIPPEVRNSIFCLALHEYEDPEHMYARDTYYTRPGFMARKKLDTSLLRTCKRIWEETQNVIWQNLEVAFFLGNPLRSPPEYGPPEYDCKGIYTLKRYWRFTPAQWSRIQHVRFISPSWALDAYMIFRIFFGDEPNFQHLRPKSITLTLRYTDWQQWHRNAAPLLPDKWFRRVIFPKSVEVVRMELETIVDKEKELDAEIDEVLQSPWLNYGRRDGMELVLSQTQQAIQEWKWAGPTTFGDGKKFAHHGEGAEMWYVVKVLTWTLDEAGGVKPFIIRVAETNQRDVADGCL